MGPADDIRHEAAIDKMKPGRYACRHCGIPLEHECEYCPECGKAGIVPIEEVMAADFAY